jgi:hypothetical protein
MIVIGADTHKRTHALAAVGATPESADVCPEAGFSGELAAIAGNRCAF